MKQRDIQELEELRIKAKLSHNKVAAHLPLDPTYWGQIRRGVKPLTKNVLEKVKSLNIRLRGFAKAG